MTKFQLFIIILFGLFLLGGILAFSVYKGKSAQDTAIPVTIWGTLDQELVNNFIQKIDSSKTAIHYTQKRPDTFDNDFLQALATGKAPDAILVSQDQLFKHSDKIVTIPYTSYPQATYKDFIQESEVYMRNDGVVAIPLSIDPLVMYWNRNIFNNAAIALPPTSWDQISSLSQILTRKDVSGNITQSAVSLGEGDNIDHTKEILSSLIFQAGNSITSIDQNNVPQLNLTQVIGPNPATQFSPAESALTFYTQFSNPTSQAYTWNRSLPEAKTYFISNKLGLYFGFATEYQEILQKNPNLNFDVALIPQIKPTATLPNPLKATYGRMYAFSITIGTKNVPNTFNAIEKLTTPDALSTWTSMTGLPSVRRDALVANPSNSQASIFNMSALWSRGWIEPDTIAAGQIFKTMVNQVTSGTADTSQAVNQAQNQLQVAYKH